MKKFICLVMIGIMTCSLCACSSSKEEANAIVKPLPAPTETSDGIFWVSPDMSTFKEDAGSYSIDCNLYSEQYYDAVEFSKLKAGDIVKVNNEDIVVSTIETNEFGLTIINGGIEEGGAEFMALESGGVLQYSGFDGYPTYDDLGVKSFKINSNVVINDSTDFESDTPVSVNIEDFASFADSHELNRLNTSIRTENNEIVEINVRFIP